LQDTVVVLGRARTAFGTYQTTPGAANCDGRSRHRLRIILDIRADRMPRPKLGGLVAMAALPTRADRKSDASACASCCLRKRADTPRRMRARKRLHAICASSQCDRLSRWRVWWPRDMAHEEVAQLFMSGTNLDLVVGLLQRAPAVAGAQPTPEEPQRPPGDLSQLLAGAIVRNGTATAEQLLEFVIGSGVLGVTDATKGSAVTAGRLGLLPCSGQRHRARPCAVAGGERRQHAHAGVRSVRTAHPLE
jgi:hypothetical protein